MPPECSPLAHIRAVNHPRIHRRRTGGGGNPPSIYTRHLGDWLYRKNSSSLWQCEGSILVQPPDTRFRHLVRFGFYAAMWVWVGWRRIFRRFEAWGYLLLRRGRKFCGAKRMREQSLWRLAFEINRWALALYSLIVSFKRLSFIFIFISKWRTKQLLKFKCMKYFFSSTKIDIYLFITFLFLFFTFLYIYMWSRNVI